MAEKLPVEVITHILQYVSVSDRKQASLVNHTWYNASLDPVLQRDMVVTVYMNTDPYEIISRFGKRKVPNISLGNLDGASNSKNVILQSVSHLAPTLQSVSLKGSNVTEKTLLTLLRNCHVLQRLDLSCCNSLFLSGQLLADAQERQHLQKALHTVTELNVSSIRHLSDVTFNRITSIFVNLEKLSLAANHFVFHMASYLQSKGGRSGESSAVLTFQNMLHFLEKRRAKIKSLNLSRTIIGDEALQTMTSISGLSLNEMVLICCREISDEGITYLSMKQRSLEILDISQCQEVTDVSVKAIAENLINLRSLSLEKLRRVTDSSIMQLHRLTQLESFNVSSCHVVSNRGLVSMLSKPHSLNNLTWINLSCCTLVRDHLVMHLCSTAPGLLHLDLGSCTGLTDVSILFISKYLKELEFLRLAWCKELRDSGLMGIPHEDLLHDVNKHDHQECRCCHKRMVPKLLNLPSIHDKQEFTEATNIVEEKLTSNIDGDYPVSLRNLEKLKHLDFTACHLLTDNSLVHALHFVELHTLHLTMCSKITDEVLCAVAANCRCVEQLYLSQCTEITNIGVINIVWHLKRLTDLDVSGCDKLTDDCLGYMATECRGLRHLDISMCAGLTLQAVEVLEQKLPYLNSINKRLVRAANNSHPSTVTDSHGEPEQDYTLHV